MVMIYYRDVKIRKLPMFCIILEIRIYCYSNLIKVRFSLFWMLCLVAKGRTNVFSLPLGAAINLSGSRMRWWLTVVGKTWQSFSRESRKAIVGELHTKQSTVSVSGMMLACRHVSIFVASKKRFPIFNGFLTDTNKCCDCPEGDLSTCLPGQTRFFNPPPCPSPHVEPLT